MSQVVTFAHVEVVPNTLVLLDIDETILFYDGIDEDWWSERIDYHATSSQCGKETAMLLSIDDWFRHISCHRPRHTDRAGLDALLRSIEDTHSHLLFITARDPKYKPITIDHLRRLGLQRVEDRVHYLGGCPKGDYIQTNLDTSSYARVVFIDDLTKNIASVTGALTRDGKLRAYQFVMNSERRRVRDVVDGR